MCIAKRGNILKIIMQETKGQTQRSKHRCLQTEKMTGKLIYNFSS